MEVQAGRGGDGRQHDDRRLRVELLDLVAEHEPRVHLLHHQVDDGQVRPSQEQDLLRLLAALGRHDLIAFGLQRQAQLLQDVRVVIDQQ
jgi:hypothetical protein